MKKLIIFLAVLTLAACSDQKSETPVASTAPVTEATTENQVSAEGRTDRAAEFIELEADDVDAPFTRERVLQLNAIVQRSLDLINEFDAQLPEISQTVLEGSTDEATAAIGKLEDMSVRSAGIVADMAEAETDLIASGEKYNDAILAGMIGFIDDVDKELKDEISTLQEQLAAR